MLFQAKHITICLQNLIYTVYSNRIFFQECHSSSKHYPRNSWVFQATYGMVNPEENETRESMV